MPNLYSSFTAEVFRIRNMYLKFLKTRVKDLSQEYHFDALSHRLYHITFHAGADGWLIAGRV